MKQCVKLEKVQLCGCKLTKQGMEHLTQFIKVIKQVSLLNTSPNQLFQGQIHGFMD